MQSVRDEHAPRVHCARAAQWPGIDVLREELGEDEFEALRDAGSGLTLEAAVALIDDTMRAARPAQ